MSSRITQPTASPRLGYATRKLAGAAFTPDDELLDVEEGHLRRFADGGADKPIVTQRNWLRAIPFVRGLTIVTYTRIQLLFLADGLHVICPLVAILRAELDASNHQTFAVRRRHSPLSMLELEPVRGEKPRQFIEGLLAVRDQERQKLSLDDRTLWEQRDQALQQSLDRLWALAAAPWPQTCVGQWLRAVLLGQHELRDRLKLRLNGGEPVGWNHDEPFVVRSVCKIAVRKLFPAGLDAEAATALVIDMRSRIHSSTPPAQHVCEAVIHEALRDPDVEHANVSDGELFHAEVAVVAIAVRTLGLDEAAIDEMIAEGERAAFAADWHPPVAPAGG